MNRFVRMESDATEWTRGIDTPEVRRARDFAHRVLERALLAVEAQIFIEINPGRGRDHLIAAIQKLGARE